MTDTTPTATSEVSVPREPTEEMAKAGRKALCAIADRMETAKLTSSSIIDFWQQVGHQPANEVYKAMLAAAPRPSANEWQPEATAPEGIYVRTKRDGEDGENVCILGVWPEGIREWCEQGPQGRTTVTHHSFAAPTHWRHLDVPSASDAKVGEIRQQYDTFHALPLKDKLVHPFAQSWTTIATLLPLAERAAAMEAENERLRKALKPFAATRFVLGVTQDDLDNARRALGETP